MDYPNLLCGQSLTDGPGDSGGGGTTENTYTDRQKKFEQQTPPKTENLIARHTHVGPIHTKTPREILHTVVPSRAGLFFSVLLPKRQNPKA